METRTESEEMINLWGSTAKHIAKICKVVEELTFEKDGEVWGMDASRTILISRLTESKFPKRATVNAELLSKILRRCEDPELIFNKHELVVKSNGSIRKTFRTSLLNTESKPKLKIDMNKYAWAKLPVSVFREIMEDALRSQEMRFEIDENGLKVLCEEDGTIFSAVLNDPELIEYEGKGKVKVNPELLKKVAETLDGSSLRIGICQDQPFYIENFNAKIFVAPLLDEDED